MRKAISILSLMILGLTVSAQTKSEKEVALAVERLKRAMVEGEKSQLEAIATDDLVYGHSGGKREDKAAFVEGIASGKSDFVTIDITEQTIQVSKKLAIVRHVLSASTNDNGKPGTVKLGIMLIWQKNHGQWKMLARQAYKI